MLCCNVLYCIELFFGLHFCSHRFRPSASARQEDGSRTEVERLSQSRVALRLKFNVTKRGFHPANLTTASDTRPVFSLHASEALSLSSPWPNWAREARIRFLQPVLSIAMFLAISHDVIPSPFFHVLLSYAMYVLGLARLRFPSGCLVRAVSPQAR